MPIASLGRVPTFFRTTLRVSPALASIFARLNFIWSFAVISIVRAGSAARSPVQARSAVSRARGARNFIARATVGRAARDANPNRGIRAGHYRA